VFQARAKPLKTRADSDEKNDATTPAARQRASLSGKVVVIVHRDRWRAISRLGGHFSSSRQARGTHA
jgi:hypothetical protein